MCAGGGGGGGGPPPPPPLFFEVVGNGAQAPGAHLFRLGNPAEKPISSSSLGCWRGSDNAPIGLADWSARWLAASARNGLAPEPAAPVRLTRWNIRIGSAYIAHAWKYISGPQPQASWCISGFLMQSRRLSVGLDRLETQPIKPIINVKSLICSAADLSINLHVVQRSCQALMRFPTRLTLSQKGALGPGGKPRAEKRNVRRVGWVGLVKCLCVGCRKRAGLEAHIDVLGTPGLRRGAGMFVLKAGRAGFDDLVLSFEVVRQAVARDSVFFVHHGWRACHSGRACRADGTLFLPGPAGHRQGVLSSAG